jgi:hypothetical protein
MRLKLTGFIIIFLMIFSVNAFPGGEEIVNGVPQTPNANITGGAINGTTIGATTPSTGAFTDLGATGTLSGRLNRDFAKLNLTEDTSISESQILNYRWVSNQGDAGEQDDVFPAVSYAIGGCVIIEEAQNIEINPPSGEIQYLDGTALDADDCIDSDSTVGSIICYVRHQDASGNWHYFWHTVSGVWIDTGASD